MQRSATWALAAWLAGCVGTNPDWDPPTDADPPDGASESESSGGEASVDTDGAGNCGDGQWTCDGECRQVQKDPLACGLGCIDCVAWLGPDAECRGGECHVEEDDD